MFRLRNNGLRGVQMKKLMLILTTILISIFLSACNDQKFVDDSINVSFFVSNATEFPIHPYENLEPGQLIEEPEIPSRPGFQFVAWFTDILYTDEWDFDTDVVGNQSFILYAQWIAAENTIIYDLNGGEFSPSTVVPTTFTTGQSRVLPIPTRLGYEFVSWYLYDWVDQSSTIPGDRGLTSIPSTHVGPLEIYAHWKSIVVVVSFRVNFPISGGPSSPNSRSIAYGSVIDFAPLPDTLGYRFVGWNSRSDATGDWYVNNEIFVRTQRLTVYAIWELI
jgi:uncharacterized repeat protein (TIGR02543 family)